MSRLINNIHFSAVVLVLLTLISTLLAESNIQANVTVLFVTLSVVIKGQQIVDIFMDLNKTQTKWRWLLLSYIILIPTILALIIAI